MGSHQSLTFGQVTEPDGMSPALTSELIDCWVTVSNAGGAVGFPFLPVSAADVAPAAGGLADGLDPQRSRLIVTRCEGALAGWVNLKHDPDPRIAHWGSIHRLQSHPAFRGRGIGTALLAEAQRIARDEMGLEQLRLSARGGMGLEHYYARLGWAEVGRWPGGLRLGPGDDRDEILMVLAPL